MKNPAHLCSFVAMFGGAFVFGLLGKPTEMGLMVVAGALGLAFANLDKFARFKGAGFEAELRHQVETIVARETEPEPPEEEASKSPDSGLSIEAYGVVGAEAPKIIRSLMNPKYTWRFVSGIAKESESSKAQVLDTLRWLEQNELASEMTSTRGKAWALTAKGLQAFAKYRQDNAV